jgi:DNA modification methylase
MFEINEPKVFFKSSENMEEVEDNSVQLIVTSPPYSKIKDYGVKEQIGFGDTFEEYFNRLKVVWGECHRVLESKCRLVINVGDQYLRKTDFGRYRILSIASKIIEDCISLGFDFLGDINWQKISTTNTTGGCSLMGSIYYPRNGLITYDYEHILIFKKVEGRDKKIDLKRKELSKISLSEWKRWFIGHWNFSGVLQKEHIAMFPEELPYRLIRMFSFIGDTILDPFLGSGTSLKVVKALFRKGIGYEINQEFKKTITNKINEGKIGLFKDFQFLIYKLWYKEKKKRLSIDYDNQKRKSFFIIEKNEVKNIIDYFIIDNDTYQKQVKAKLNENSIKNFLNNKIENIEEYLIIVNDDIDEDILKEINNRELKEKKIRFMTINDYLNSLKRLSIQCENCGMPFKMDYNFTLKSYCSEECRVAFQKKEFELPEMVMCLNCHGEGWASDIWNSPNVRERCRACRGGGKVKRIKKDNCDHKWDRSSKNIELCLKCWSVKCLVCNHITLFNKKGFCEKCKTFYE